jgi:flagellar export protein FliJ
VHEALARVGAQALEGAARLAASIQRPVSGGEVALHAGFAAALAGRRDRLARQGAEVAVEVAERRAALRERWRAREAVAQLRRQALAHHQASVEREEQITLDEVAAVRHGWAGPGPAE